MVNLIIAAGLQYQQMNFANRYAAAVIDQVQSVQEMIGSEAVALIEEVANAAQAVSADPNLGRNIDVIV